MQKRSQKWYFITKKCKDMTWSVKRKSALFYCFLLYFMYCVKLLSFHIDLKCYQLGGRWSVIVNWIFMVIWFYVFVWNQLTLPFPLLWLFSVNRNFVLSTHVIWLTNKLIWFTRKFHSLHYITWRSRTEAAAAIKFVNVEPLFLNEPKKSQRENRHFGREEISRLPRINYHFWPWISCGFGRKSSTNDCWRSCGSPGDPLEDTIAEI